MDKPSLTYATVSGGMIKPELPVDGWEGKRVLIRIEEAPAQGGSTAQVHEDQLFQIVFGHNLAPLSSASPGLIKEQIRLMRARIQKCAGVHLPTVRLSVRNDMDPDTYCIYCEGELLGQARAWADRIMVIVNDPMEKIQLTQFQGHQEKDPLFGLPCVWTMPISRLRADHLGLKCIAPETAIAIHAEELFLRNIGRVLSLENVEDLLSHCPAHTKELIRETIPNHLTIRQLHSILRTALSQRKSIADLSPILQTARKHQGLPPAELAALCAKELADF